MKLLHPDRRALTILIVGAAVLVLIALVARYATFLGTQVLTPAEREALLGGYLTTDQLTEGEHTLTFEAKTQSGERVSASTTFTVGSSPTPTPTPTATPVSGFTVTEVCIDPTDFEVSIRWSPKDATIRFRPVPENDWHYPYVFNSTPYLDSDNSRHVLIFNGQDYQSPGYFLDPDTDFQFYLLPTGTTTDPITDPNTTIYRFNSGPAPTFEEYFKSPCEFRRLL